MRVGCGCVGGSPLGGVGCPLLRSALCGGQQCAPAVCVCVWDLGAGPWIRVSGIAPNSPAALSASIVRGDVFVSVNGYDLTGVSTSKAGTIISTAFRESRRWLLSILPADSPILSISELSNPLPTLSVIVMPAESPKTYHRALHSGCFDRRTDKVLEIGYHIKSQMGDVHAVRDVSRVQHSQFELMKVFEEYGQGLHALLDGTRPGEGTFRVVIRHSPRSMTKGELKQPSFEVVRAQVDVELVVIGAKLSLPLAESGAFRFVEHVRPAAIADSPSDNMVRYSKGA